MQINEVINETQKHFLQENINIDKAVEQHKKFVAFLKVMGRRWLSSTMKKNSMNKCLQGILASDHDHFMVASMNTDVRRGEVKTLKKWLRSK